MKDVLTRLRASSAFLQELAKLGRSVGSGSLDVPHSLEDPRARQAHSPNRLELGKRRK